MHPSADLNASSTPAPPQPESAPPESAPPESAPAAPEQASTEPAALDDGLSRRNAAVIAAVAAAFAGVLLLQSLLHGRITGINEYDDGVYFGASLNLIHGVLPYRDFVFLQPPMVAVWMSPFAALSSLTGTAGALVAARIFTDLIAVANVVLAGLLVRRRPTLQVAVTTGFLAFYPATVLSAKTVMLEPLVVFGCLIALRLVFDGDRITRSGRRVLIAGLVFGLAGATKTWAVLPLLALLAVPSASAGEHGVARYRLRLVAGAAIGFAVCSLPFLIVAPSAFVNQIVIIQAIRNGGGYSTAQRLADLTGLPGLTNLVTLHRPFLIVVLAVYALVILLLARILTGRRRLYAEDPLGWFSLLATVLTALSLLMAPVYFYHYAAFAAPFLALLLGTLVINWRDRLAGNQTAALAVLAIPAVLIGTMAMARLSAVVTAPAPAQVSGAIKAAIPARGCVVSFSPSVPILANRFTSATPGCPHVIDWLAVERVNDHGVASEPSDVTSPAVQAAFGRWIAGASVLVVQQPNPGWNAAVAATLRRDFRLHEVMRSPYPLFLYLRK